MINKIFEEFKELQLVYKTLDMLTDLNFVKRRFQTNLIRDRVLVQLCLMVTRKVRFKTRLAQNLNLLVWPVCVWLFDQGILEKCDEKLVLDAVLERMMKIEKLNVSESKNLFRKEEFVILDGFNELQNEKVTDSLKIVILLPKEHDKIKKSLEVFGKVFYLKKILVERGDKFELLNE